MRRDRAHALMLLGAGLVIAAAAVVVASAALTVYRWRSGMDSMRALESSLVDVLAAASLILILLLTMVPMRHAAHTLDLVPFRDIRTQFRSPRDAAETLVEAGGNIVLFMPLGFFLPLAVRRLDRLSAIALFAAVLSICIELIQYIFPLGRVSSTQDVLTNTTGGICGFLLMRATRRSPTLARTLLTKR